MNDGVLTTQNSYEIMSEEEKQEIEETSPEEDEPEEQSEKTIEKPPTQPDNDFMAGAILANGISFVWMQLLSVARDFFSRIPPVILVDISYIIYIFAGYYSTNQVLKRSKGEHLRAAFKTAGYSSVMGLLIIFTMFNDPNFRLAITVSLCYFFGSIIASYMTIKRRIRS